MKQIQIILDGIQGSWLMDYKKIDDNLVLFGFEEHELDDESEQVFKTEQVLSREDLLKIERLISNALGELR